MKKISFVNFIKIHKIKSLLIIALLFSALTSNAQLTMSFGTTNAATVTSSGLTYTATIPFFASSLTANFKITKTSFTCTTPGAIKTMSVNNLNTGAFIANNGSTNTNYVNLPNTYTFPVGTTVLKVRSECYVPDLSNAPVYNTITVIVTKLPDPILNITLTPYCQIDNHTGNYTNYFGYKVSGSATNRNGLRFKVLPDNALACPTQTYWNLNTTFAFTSNNFNAGSGFYSCNYATWYTVYLEYVYTPYGAGSPVIYPIATGTYGWQDYRWRKTITVCLPVMDPGKDQVELGGKSAPSQTSVFPNPTDGLLKINVSEVEKAVQSVKVYDLTNVLLLELNNVKNNEIDLSNLKNGTYILHIETSNGILTKQVIKN